jgi:hypothetical protein
VLEDPDVRAAVLRAARDPESPAFVGTLKLLMSYGHGLPTQRVQLTGLAAFALRVEQLSVPEVQRLLQAPDEELEALVPGEREADADE